MTLTRFPVQITGPMLPDPAMNIWHARVGDAWPTNKPGHENVVTALSNFYNQIKGLYPSGCTISFDGTAQEVGTAEPQYIDGLTSFTVAATGSSDSLPAANALLVSWRTSLATRRGRGRTFIGPVVVSAAENNGTPEESNRSALQGAVNALVAASTAPDSDAWAIGVWSPTDGVLRDITSGTVPNRFGVIRSRRD